MLCGPISQPSQQNDSEPASNTKRTRMGARASIQANWAAWFLKEKRTVMADHGDFFFMENLGRPERASRRAFAPAPAEPLSSVDQSQLQPQIRPSRI